MNLLEDLKALKEKGEKDTPLNTLLMLCKKHRVSVTPVQLAQAKKKAKLKDSPGNKLMKFHHLSHTAAQKLAKEWTKEEES